MKFDRSLYNKYLITKDTPYFSIIRRSEANQLISTFKDNKKLPIYSWFGYKQGFSPNLVKKIVLEFNMPCNSIIYDPFLGSGTTALASIFEGYTAWGSDQLPLCEFISRSKIDALSINPSDIIEAAKRLLLKKHSFGIKWPQIPIVVKAVPENIQIELMNLKINIENSTLSRRLKNVLLLALLSSIDSCAYVKKDGGFLRITKNKNILDPREVFIKNCNKFYEDLGYYHKQISLINRSNLKKNKIFVGDARSTSLPNSSVDMVITSPPYLNKTDYTRVYSLELSMMFINTFDDLRKLRYNSFCGHVESKPIYPKLLLPDSITKLIKELSTSDLSNPKHPYMVEGYFQDLFKSLLENYRYLKRGGIAAWVVWNSRLSGIHFPVDILLAELAEYSGFKIENIDCLRLTGTSAQQAKLYGELPLRESIVYIKKLQ